MKLVNDNPVFENFVSPNLCQYLKDAGLTDCVQYDWIIKAHDGIELQTRIFDQDNYYADTWQLLHTMQGNKTFPAYSIKDVEKCLPNWFMNKDETGYEISLEKIWNIESSKSDRLPDAIASLVLISLRKGIINVEKINSILTYPQTLQPKIK